jgi:hypothetical protein
MMILKSDLERMWREVVVSSIFRDELKETIKDLLSNPYLLTMYDRPSIALVTV